MLETLDSLIKMKNIGKNVCINTKLNPAEAVQLKESRALG